MFETFGVVYYFENFCSAYIDDEIGKYYRSLLPKALYIQPPKRKTHVSIVRPFEFKECKTWDVKKCCAVRVIYYHSVQNDGVYYWLNCTSKSIGQIRLALGLPEFRNKFGTYHITIGNRKWLLKKN